MIRRIAYVVRTFSRLSQTFVLREIEWLLAHGFDCRLFFLHRSEEIVQQPLARCPRILERLHVLDVASDAPLEGFAPDIVHAHFATDATRAALEVGGRGRIPVTFTAHGYDIYREPPSDWVARAGRAAFVITVSEANRRHLVEAVGVPPEKIRVVANGVDTGSFAPDPREPKPDVFHIACVARLEPVKQLHLLLEACAFLKRGGVPFRCTVAGEGTCREFLLCERTRLLLADQVRFIGPVDSDGVRQLLRSAHVAVLTSQSEGCPVCLLEAAATGVPAVAPAVGGVPEIIVDGETGFVVVPGDATALGSALRRLGVDRRLADAMGHAARRRAVRRFSIDRQMASLLEVWEEAVRTHA